jgi:hypothetical protein
MRESQELSLDNSYFVAPSVRKTARHSPSEAFRGDVVGSMTLVRLATAKGRK